MVQSRATAVDDEIVSLTSPVTLTNPRKLLADVEFNTIALASPLALARVSVTPASNAA
jgi:hypothetical protein